MPDGVHALVHAMQPSRRHSAASRARAETELAQLVKCHDSVLLCGQLRELEVPIAGGLVEFGPVFGRNSTNAVHGAHHWALTLTDHHRGDTKPGLTSRDGYN
jgi:hypothetical protein